MKKSIDNKRREMMRNIFPRFLSVFTHIFAGIDNSNLADDCLEPYCSGGTKLLLPGAKADFSIFCGIYRVLR